MSGNIWISIGVVCLAISAFAIPYGFHLKSKEDADKNLYSNIRKAVHDEIADVNHFPEIERLKNISNKLVTFKSYGTEIILEK